MHKRSPSRAKQRRMARIRPRAIFASPKMHGFWHAIMIKTLLRNTKHKTPTTKKKKKTPKTCIRNHFWRYTILDGVGNVAHYMFNQRVHAYITSR